MEQIQSIINSYLISFCSRLREIYDIDALSFYDDFIKTKIQNEEMKTKKRKTRITDIDDQNFNYINKPKFGNSIAEVCPGLIQEWLTEKNKGYSPNDFNRGSDIKVWWKCSKGHEYKTAIVNRTKGHGCRICNQSQADSQRYSSSDFIQKAVEVHGDLYDYSKVNYQNCKTPVTIICKMHGEFSQIPSDHLASKGCRECGYLRMKIKQRLTNEEFIKRAREIHGDWYDYSKVEYENTDTKIKIICKIHGEFSQIAGVHIYNKSGCPKCKGGRRLSTDDFKRRAREIHEDLYDYSKVEYKGNKIPVVIICKIHGDFNQTPIVHICHGSGCKDCGFERMSRERILSFEEIKRRAREIHGDLYEYPDIEYKGQDEYINIICKIHGIFPQRSSNHIFKRYGCPKCKLSKMEQRMAQTLNNLSTESDLDITIINKSNWVKPFHPDFSILFKSDSEHKIIMEMDGRQHFQEVKFFGGSEGFLKTIERDKKKNNICKKKNINLLRISHSVDFELYPEIVYEFLLEVIDSSSAIQRFVGEEYETS